MQGFALVLIFCSALVLQASAQLDPVCDNCPSKNSSYEKKLSCYCSGSNRTIEIVSPEDFKYVNVSLRFALDNTGSMGAELLTIKASIQDVVVQTAGIFDKFVIGIFNDPYVPTLIESMDPTAIGTFLAPVVAFDGGDCPEMALTGIQDVVTRVSPGSIIFVITDASAKDLTLEPAVLALLQSKNIRLNVMATGGLCAVGLGGEFTRLTSATNGTIYKTFIKTDVDYVMNYIKNFAKYGVRFIRGMPISLEDLKAIAGGTCSCDTTVSNLVCIALPCPEGFLRVETKSTVCSPKPCNSKLGTLGFVIDNTGSMGAEIAALKSAISGIIAANTVFTDYVAGQFGDPYVKSVIKSAVGSVIKSFVNAIVANGGGDCPESAMSGIEDAANLALHNSVLILFTDASAKDRISKLSAVRALLVSD